MRVGVAGALAWVALALGVGCGQQASPSPTPIRTGTAACSTPAAQPDAGRKHVSDLDIHYDQAPAASGSHFPVWLPPDPQFYDVPWPEARAVHNLEHGYVIVYYRQGDATQSALANDLYQSVRGQPKILIGPYPRLASGVGVEFVAWDETQPCPLDVSTAQAKAALNQFVKDFRESSRAPEPSAP